MCGVAFTRLPYALIACAAWSSDITNTKFGRCRRMAPSLVTGPVADPARNTGQFSSSAAAFACHVLRILPSQMLPSPVAPSRQFVALDTSCSLAQASAYTP